MAILCVPPIEMSPHLFKTENLERISTIVSAVCVSKFRNCANFAMMSNGSWICSLNNFQQLPLQFCVASAVLLAIRLLKMHGQEMCGNYVTVSSALALWLLGNGLCPMIYSPWDKQLKIQTSFFCNIIRSSIWCWMSTNRTRSGQNVWRDWWSSKAPRSPKDYTLGQDTEIWYSHRSYR